MCIDFFQLVKWYLGMLFLSQVHGIVQDRNGRTVATLFGKWDESMHYVLGDYTGKLRGSEPLLEARLLWKRSKPPNFPTRYNFTRFAITLNELTPGLKVSRSYAIWKPCPSLGKGLWTDGLKYYTLHF